MFLHIYRTSFYYNDYKKKKVVLMNIRILITDDDQAIHEVFQLGLEMALKTVSSSEGSSALSRLTNKNVSNDIDLTIDHAYSGEQAVEMVSKSIESSSPYTLILMDIMMPPGIDGLEAIQKISNTHDDQQFIICTAYHTRNENELREACIKTKRSFLLAKPFNLNYFSKLIQNIIFRNEIKPEFQELLIL